MKHLFLIICFLTLHVSAQVKPVSKQKTKSKPVAPTEEFVEVGNRKASFVGGEEAMEKFNITKPGPELGQAIQKMEADLFKSVL